MAADKPINLRRARKARQRAEARAQADTNAAAHGVPRAVRDLADARRSLELGRHEGHRRADPKAAPKAAARDAAKPDD